MTNFGYHLILITDRRPSDYQNLSDEEYESVTKTLTINVNAEVGKAIIVLGGGNAEVNPDWRTFSSVANYVHKVLLRRQFDNDEDIYFLSPAPKETENADNTTFLFR